MKKIISVFQKYPFFLVLLPVYFVFHGFTENYGLVPVPDAAKLAAVYIASILLFFSLLFLFYKHLRRAALGACLITAINLFFGPVHDLLKKTFPGSFIVKYSFLLPLIFILLVLVLIASKRKKWMLRRTTLYLNLLLAILIIIEIPWLFAKVINSDNPARLPVGPEFSLCDSCQKPDIYLILADEYAGKKELEDVFSFDNHVFFQQLRDKDFYICDSTHSNYNLTIFSTASTLNMEYLDIKHPENPGKYLALANETILQNKTARFLTAAGYEFHNFSSYPVINHPPSYPEQFMPQKAELITSQTLLDRLTRDLGFHLITTLKLNWAIERNLYKERNYNEDKITATLNVSKEKTPRPKFVFTHLFLPHFPYYFDRLGNPVEKEKLQDEKASDQQAYLEYLQYSNNVLIKLIDELKNNSHNASVIILYSDHGFRQFNQPVDPAYSLMNFCSIYLPTQNYTEFYRGMSNVNLFRVFFNTQFHQKLPLLTDDSTTIFPLN